MIRLILISSFLFNSCASYVNSFHRQIDNEERAKQAQRARYEQRYGQRRGEDNRPIQNPVTLGGVPTANNVRDLAPGTRRKYNANGTRRYKAKDLQDNGKDGSLWSGDNSDSFLFVTNNLKRAGDIVIIEVLNPLKDKIQDELKRNFPEAAKKTKKTSDKKDDAKKEENVADAKAAESNEPDKVYDKISAKVVELVNSDYLLVRGRKEIMYNKRKRYFDIQAVISQKDITSTDTVKSNKILEPKINVLRY